MLLPRAEFWRIWAVAFALFIAFAAALTAIQTAHGQPSGWPAEIGHGDDLGRLR